MVEVLSALQCPLLPNANQSIQWKTIPTEILT